MLAHPPLLLVEPDAERAAELRGVLADAQFQVAIGASGEAGLDLLGGDEAWALLVVSWKLPDMNGVKFIRSAVREGSFEGGVVLYDCGALESAEERLAALAEDYPFDYQILEEPCDVTEILEALDEVRAAD